MDDAHHPRTELLIIELRRVGWPTYTFATNVKDWKHLAAGHTVKVGGPRLACMFHWAKVPSMDKQAVWHLIAHEELQIDCF